MRERLAGESLFEFFSRVYAVHETIGVQRALWLYFAALILEKLPVDARVRLISIPDVLKDEKTFSAAMMTVSAEWALKHPEELKRTTTSVLVQVPVQVPSGSTEVPVKTEVLAYREKEKEKKKRKWAEKTRYDDNKGCFRCHSKTHWKRDCPVWLSEQASEQRAEQVWTSKTVGGSCEIVCARWSRTCIESCLDRLWRNGVDHQGKGGTGSGGTDLACQGRQGYPVLVNVSRNHWYNGDLAGLRGRFAFTGNF